MTQKTVIVIPGYHQAGAGTLAGWFADHAGILAPHLELFTEARTRGLRDAARALARGRAGAAEALAEACAALAEEIRDSAAPLAVIAEEDLFGPPLGHVEQGFAETEIYPGLGRIAEGLGAGFGGFELVLAVFEREAGDWLQDLHALQVWQGAFDGDFGAFLARFEPVLDWHDLRHEIRFGLRGRGRLESFSFEEEFRQGTLAGSEFFALLDIPRPLLARCRPRLAPPVAPTDRSHAVPRVPQHRALVLGGANALTVEGWVALLQQHYNALIEIENLSGGGVTSAMMLYRLLTDGARWPGVPVLWEQGINEYIHQTGGQDLDSLMYHAEWLLQTCIRQDRPVVPVLMRTRVQSALENEGAYITRIRALFAAYGLRVIDCDRLLAVAARGPVELDLWYRGNAIYADGTGFAGLLAETALLALDEARVPQAPPDRAAHFEALDLVLRRPADCPEILGAAGREHAFAPFAPGLRVNTPGRVLAAILATGESGPVIRLSAGDTVLGRYATQISVPETHPPTQLRQLILTAGADGLEIPGGVVQIDPDDSSDPPTVQTMYLQGERPPEPLPTGLAALLCEEPRRGAA